MVNSDEERDTFPDKIDPKANDRKTTQSLLKHHRNVSRTMHDLSLSEKKLSFPDKSGIVRKRAGLLNGWKTFWLELTHMQGRDEPVSLLQLYEGDNAKHGKLVETYNLSETLITLPHFRVPQCELYLTLTGEKPSVVMQFGTAEDRDSWMAALKEHAPYFIRKPLMEAVLLKTGSGMRRWHPRYFVLYSDSVNYYKDATNITPIGSIPLTEGAECEQHESEDSSRFVFSLARTGDENERQYMIAAENEKTREKWMGAIRDAIKLVDCRKDPTSLKEGYLWKTGQSGKAWHKRFFVMHADRLLYYQMRHDWEPSGVIELPPAFAVIRSIAPDRNQRPFQFYVAKNQDEKGVRRFYLAALSESNLNDWESALNKLNEGRKMTVHPDSIREGYLWKKGAVNKNWTFRYCILLKDKLLYYRSKDDYENKVKEAGEMLLSGSALIDLPGRDIVRLYAFYIQEDGDEGTRKYFIAGDTAEIAKSWVKSLLAVRDMHERNVNPNSLLEGHLWKTSSDRMKWAKRYFILLPDKLQYFKKRADFAEGVAPAGEIEIPGSAYVDDCDVDPNTKGEFLVENRIAYPFLVARNGDTLTRQYVLAALTFKARKVWKESVKTLAQSKDWIVHADGIKEGYLELRSDPAQAWAKFYCILEYNKLFWTARRDDFVNALEKEQGLEDFKSKEILGSTEVQPVSTDKSSTTFTVASSGDFDAKLLYIRAPSAAMCTEWLETLAQVLATKKSKVMPSSLLEIYLWKYGPDPMVKKNPKKIWSKRFAVLTRDTLHIYERRGDFKNGKVGESVPLDGCRVSQEDSLAGMNFVMSIDCPPADIMFLGMELSASFENFQSHIQSIIASRSTYVRHSQCEGYLEYYYDKVNSEVPSPIRRGFEIPWKRYYMMLSGDRMEFCDSRSDFEDAAPLEPIAFSKQHVVDQMAAFEKMGGKKKDVFSVYIDDVNKGRHWFSADVRGASQSDIKTFITASDEWRDVLKSLITSKKGHVHPNAIQEGTMDIMPQGHSRRNRRKRYFILLGDVLLYYKTKDSFARGVAAEGRIPLLHSSVVSLDPLPSDHKHDFKDDDFPFYLAANGDEGTRSEVLLPETKQSRRDWLREIFRVLRVKVSGENVHAIKESYLRVTYSRARLHGNTRYLILVDDQLLIFTKRSDPRPMVTIVLDPSSTITASGGDDDTTVTKFSVEARTKSDATIESFVFEAKDAGQKAEWIESVSTVIQWAKENLIMKRVRKLFGSTLDDGFARATWVPNFPDPIALTVTHLLKHGVDKVHLYDHNVDTMLLKQIVHDFDMGTSTISTFPDSQTAAAILCTYLHELQHPVIPYNLYDKFVDIVDTEMDFSERSLNKYEIARLNRAISLLPEQSYLVLNYVLHFVSVLLKENSWQIIGDFVRRLAPAMLRASSQDKTQNNLMKAALVNSQKHVSSTDAKTGYRESQARPSTTVFTSSAQRVLAMLVNGYDVLFGEPPAVYTMMPEEQLASYRGQLLPSLEEMFNDPFGLACYVAFTEETFTDENIKFCMAVREYQASVESMQVLFGLSGKALEAYNTLTWREFGGKTLRKGDSLHSTMEAKVANKFSSRVQGRRMFKKVKEQLSSIVDMYIDSKGSRCLNVSAKDRSVLLAKFEGLRECTPSTLTGDEFSSAVTVVERLMVTNSYKRFIREKNKHFDRWITTLVGGKADAVEKKERAEEEKNRS